MNREEHARRVMEGKAKAALAREEAVSMDNPKKQTTPWKPARVLDIPQKLKDPNYTYRWCDVNKVGNIQKKLQEGWVIDKELGEKLSRLHGLNTSLQDGSPLDSTVRLRELIVMKMPKDMADSRNQYYQNRASLSSRDVKNRMHRETMDQKPTAKEKWGDDTVVVYGDYQEEK